MADYYLTVAVSLELILEEVSIFRELVSIVASIGAVVTPMVSVAFSSGWVPSVQAENEAEKTSMANNFFIVKLFWVNNAGKGNFFPH